MTNLPLLLMIAALLVFIAVLALSDNRKSGVLQWMLIGVMAAMIGSDLSLEKRQVFAALMVSLAAFQMWRSNRKGTGAV